MSCIWTHSTENTTESSSEQTIYIYDAGQYMGMLFPDDTWLCWRVLKRVLDGTVVTETIEVMPADWTPINVISVEEYPLLSYIRQEHTVEASIPAWNISINGNVMCR
jgi:hypothetical protein